MFKTSARLFNWVFFTLFLWPALIHANGGVFLTPVKLSSGPDAPGVALSMMNPAGTRYTAYVYSPSGAQLVSIIPLTPEKLVGVASIPDLDGNGADEIGSLELTSEGWVVAKVKDSLTGELISKMSFDPAYHPAGLRTVPPAALGSSSGLAVLGINSDGRPRVQLRDATSGALISRVFFDPAFAPFAFEVLGDLDGNGIPEFVVFGVDAHGRVRAQVKDGLTGELVSMVWFDRTFRPVQAVVLDMTGDGRVDALAVLGENAQGVYRVQVKDAVSGAPLANVRFESGYTPTQLLAISDADGSGAPELGVLQVDAEGRVRLQVKDARTGNPVRIVSFPGGYDPRFVFASASGGPAGGVSVAYLGRSGVGNVLLQVVDIMSRDVLGEARIGPDTPPPSTPELFVVGTVSNGHGTIDPSLQLVPRGAIASLSVAAGEGQHLAGISGCNGSLSAITYVTSPVSAHCTIKASFDPNRYEISVSSSRGGSTDGGGTYPHGSQVTIEAEVLPGYEFLYWSEGGTPVSHNPILKFTAITTRQLVAQFGPRSDVIIGSVNGFDRTRPTLVTLTSIEIPDTLRVIELPAGGEFKFEGLSPQRSYSVSVAQAGYRFSAIQEPAAGMAYLMTQATTSKSSYEPGEHSSTGVFVPGSETLFVGVQIDGLEDNRFLYEWQGDVSVSGAEYASYVNQPLSIEIIGSALTEADTHAAVALFQRYAIVLVDDELPWSPEHSSRLLQSVARTGTTGVGPGEGSPQFSTASSRWHLTEEILENDIDVSTGEDGVPIVRVSAAAFTYAAPLLVTIEGKRGRFYSHRLFRAVTRFVTDAGRDINMAADILRRRYGVLIARDEYFDGLYGTLPIIDEDRYPGVWQVFQPEEVVELIAMLEEFPEGMRDLSLPGEPGGLRYVLRRRNGLPHPIYPNAPAVAWTGAHYIEFMDLGFTSPKLSEIQRLIIHEKAHFLWDYSFSAELKYEWLKLSGWYRPTGDAADGDCDVWSGDPASWTPANVSPFDLSALTPLHDHPPAVGEPHIRPDWASCSTTQFVSAYAGSLDPNEDMAESIAFFLTNPDQLRSAALPKYDFIRDHIMQGQIYVSIIRPDLTFEVLNLYPDYIYPGKINRVMVEVLGAPFDDKIVNVTIGLTGDDSCMTVEGTPCFSGASGGYFRVFSPVGTFVDAYFRTQNYGSLEHTLVTQLTLPDTAAAGWWTPRDIVIFDQVGNRRIEKIANGDFGWRMYVNNPNADTTPPVYVPNSLDTVLLYPGQTGAAEDLSADEREVRIRWRIIEDREAGFCLSRVVGFSEVATSRELFYDNYGPHEVLSPGQYDGATHACETRWRVTPFFASGLYGAGSIAFGDRAGNRNGAMFAVNHPNYEEPVLVRIDNDREDLIPPVLVIAACTTDDPEERCIRVRATPVNPDFPDGETVVRIRYWAYEVQELYTASGLRQAGIVLRNPQGQEFFYHHGDGSTGVHGRSPRLHDRYFQCPELVAQEYPGCDATTQIPYEFEVKLPVGSAPGVWGVTEITIKDHAGNYSRYQFTEVVTFEID